LITPCSGFPPPPFEKDNIPYAETPARSFFQ
jgi:hypothetical protein